MSYTQKYGAYPIVCPAGFSTTTPDNIVTGYIVTDPGVWFFLFLGDRN